MMQKCEGGIYEVSAAARYKGGMGALCVNSLLGSLAMSPPHFHGFCE